MSPSSPPTSARPIRLLITAGPTHEPIDSVRFIGNRSSGRLGIAIAEAAARRRIKETSTGPGPWQVCLALGPTALTPSDSSVRLLRFRTAADLQALLTREVPTCDILIMAAAVADYRPRPTDPSHGGKIRRTDQTLTLELEPTPDLLAGIGASRLPGQLIVGFALEPECRLLESARSKLERKRIDLIVANPLETMDAPDIRATIVGRSGVIFPPPGTAASPQSKELFAETLLDLLEREFNSRAIRASSLPGA